MKLDQLLLGQIPEAIYFALFMILVKNIKEKRILSTILMILEYIFLKYFLAYNIWFQIMYFVEPLLDYRYNRMFTYPGETVGDFAERCIIGTYLVTMPNHITTVIDGVVYDTFDCRDRGLWDVWKVL